jgi:hypothetical protein
MPEEVIDATPEVVKGAVNSGDFNTNADAYLDSLEQSSGSKDAMGNPIPPKEDSGVDQTKKASPVEEVKELSSEEQKLKQISDILGDDAKTIEAYIKKMGYHNDPAWQKLLTKSRTPAIDEATSKQLEEFKQLTSDPEYIRLSMKRQGYTDEAIDKVLADKGFTQPEKPSDDLTLIANSLGMKVDQFDPNTKAVISDVARIADIIFKNRMDKILPSTMKPMEDMVSNIAQTNNANKMLSTMQETVKAEGVLDFKQDIEPELHKFIDANPEATQQDLANHFKEVSYRLTVDRLKTGKKTVERADKKAINRPNFAGQGKGEINIPKKTGKFNEDADAILDSLGYHE